MSNVITTLQRRENFINPEPCIRSPKSCYTSYETAHFPLLRGLCKRLRFPIYSGLFWEIRFISFNTTSIRMKVSSSPFIMYGVVKLWTCTMINLLLNTDQGTALTWWTKKQGKKVNSLTHPIVANSNCLENHQLIMIHKGQNDNISKIFCFFL